MMHRGSPEQAGVSSAKLHAFIKALEDAALSTHDLILARGGTVFFEQYWPPFTPDSLHRMYSVTKSFVALAIGFLEQDGLLALDDPMSKFFAAELEGQQDENLKNQTVRHMLMMSTAKPCEDWFGARPKDRVRFYFQNRLVESRPSGTVFQYDSSGSFVLCALAERLCGMPLMEYLRVKLFDKIGVSKEAYCLACPGGHSWGDSGLLCTPMDLLKVARFVMDKGRHNGEQILNEPYITAAVSKQIDNNPAGLEEFDTQGYGYQIWRSYRNSFFFNGMGCQFSVCVPDKDLIMVYNGDNQGKPFAKKTVFEHFFRLVDFMADSPVPEVQADTAALSAYTAQLKLAVARGKPYSEFEETINGVPYTLAPNPMGITECTFFFEAEGGRFEYTNAQGKKTLLFGRCENVFSLFPETGYADMVGATEAPGHQYRCAVSAAWIEPQKLFCKVQIIDAYFGTLNINIGFQNQQIGIYMNKCAEDFLNEYQGFAGGVMKE